MNKKDVDGIVKGYFEDVIGGKYLKNAVKKYLDDRLPDVIDDVLDDLDLHTPALAIVQDEMKNIKFSENNLKSIRKAIVESLMEGIEDDINDFVCNDEGIEVGREKIIKNAINDVRKRMKF